MKTVGIIGGMGPMATADLFTKIVAATPAEKDQDHIPVIIYNNPQVPPRVEAILHGGESPLPELIRMARWLEAAGAELLAMPCNTAHYWHADIQAAVRAELVNMIEVAAAYWRQRDCSGAEPLLLTTAAAIQGGVYQRVFQRCGLGIRIPERDEQEIVTGAILAVKTGRLADNPFLEPLRALLDNYYRRGVPAAIGGCTEIPLLFPHLRTEAELIDPTLLLARALVERALGTTSSQP